MPEVLSQALATPGLGWMLLTISAAGLVRGFTGFGTGMIFMPVGAQFLPVPDLLLMMVVINMISSVAVVPGAFRAADRGEAFVMAGAAAVTVPLGLWILTQLDVLTVRWFVTLVVSATLAAVITGWRWHGTLGLGGRIAIGGAAGTLGGVSGLTGPVAIIFYLANARSALSVRANTILFLSTTDVAVLASLLLSGVSDLSVVWVAALLLLPYLVTTLIGKSVFDPAHERIYRTATYGVIGLAVISGLPILD